MGFQLSLQPVYAGMNWSRRCELRYGIEDARTAADEREDAPDDEETWA